MGCGALLRVLVSLVCSVRPALASHAQPPSQRIRAVAELAASRRSTSVGRAQRATCAPARGAEQSAKQSALLAQQLAAPDKSVEAAPAVRAKLLDELADALGSVVYLTGQLNAGHEEQAELEGELTELMAGADAAATVAAADPEQRMAALKAKQRALLLKTRARLGGPLPSGDKQAKLAAELEAWKQQQREATAQLAKVDAEPRFASLTATPPRNMQKPATVKKGKVETLRACSVRDVDWRNITIDVGGRSVQLIDGQGPLAPGDASVRIKDVSYGDSNGNGREEVFLLVDREEFTRTPAAADGERAGRPVRLRARLLQHAAARRPGALDARRVRKPVSGGYDHDGRYAILELRLATASGGRQCPIATLARDPLTFARIVRSLRPTLSVFRVDRAPARSTLRWSLPIEQSF